MTQDDKQLLLKDLCMRLPYGVMIQHPELFYPSRIVIEELVSIDREHINDDGFTIEYIKPYLRSMSSMTDKEKREFYDICTMLSADKNHFIMEGSIDSDYMLEKFDWLNTHHFDYRGLIENDLAIAVTEQNNPYKD